MNEIEEILQGKNLADLKLELEFQLKNGESLGGAICSEIVYRIEKLGVK